MELTIIQEGQDTVVLTQEPDPEVLEIVADGSDPTVLEIVTEGPRGPTGPPDTRPRPSDIAFNIFGGMSPNEILLRLELGATTTLVPARCRASAEEWPANTTTIQITLEANNINRAIANVVFTANAASFSFSNNLVLEPGIIRVLSPSTVTGLRDFSITLSGDR